MAFDKFPIFHMKAQKNSSILQEMHCIYRLKTIYDKTLFIFDEKLPVIQ